MMLHLARKAFYPVAAAVPAAARRYHLEVPDMYALRDQMAAEAGHRADRPHEPRGDRARHQPVRPRLGAAHRHVEDRGPKQALDKYGFDAAFGGARRDEEKSRAKERVFSLPRRPTIAGTRRTSGPSSGALQRRASPGEIDPRLPAVELDRARHLAIHPPREHPDRAALLRRRAAGGRARRHAASWSTTSACRCSPARSRRCAASASARSAAIR